MEQEHEGPGKDRGGPMRQPDVPSPGPEHIIREKGLPANTEAERFVLGSVLLDERVLHEVAAVLTEDDWHNPRHWCIFRAMLQLSRKRSAVDVLTLADQLRSQRLLERAGGFPYLVGLTDGLPRLANIGSYVRIVRDKSRLRQMIAAARSIMSACLDESRDVADVFADAQATVLHAGSDPQQGSAAKGVMEGHKEPLPDPLLREPGWGGSVLARGSVAVLSGAGGRGKSTLAMQWAAAAALADAAGQPWAETGGVAVRAGRTLLASYEDAAPQLARRASGALTLPSLQALAGTRESPADACNARIRVHILRGHPLFGVRDGDHRDTRPQPLPAWYTLWHSVTQHRPDLLVLDPAMSAFVGNSHAVEFVRLFLDALFESAERHGCGVLLLAHSTKAARRPKDSDPTGAVAGSAAWTDAARGVLVLDVPRKGLPARERHRVLRLEKSNHSRLYDRVLDVRTEAVEEPEAGYSYAPLRGFEDTGLSEHDWQPEKGANGAGSTL